MNRLRMHFSSRGRRICALLAALALVAPFRLARAQSGEWTWVGGNSTLGPDYTPDGTGFNVYARPGVYGMQGQFAAGNIPGGRFDAINWTDAKGNQWIFSGFGDDANANQGFPNDLWEYNPAKNEWAWMGGSSTIAGTNYGHGGVCPATRGTFASGNMPGSRYAGVAWTDQSGNLWLFGGFGFDAASSFGYLNDIWEFNPTLGTYGEWTWMGGSCTVPSANGGQSGVYPAEPGTTGSTYVPGGRIDPASWIDKSGSLWLFGGLGFDSTGAFGWLNDLWKFDPATMEWTWMAGSSTIGTNCSPLHTTYPSQVFCGQVGSYGTRGKFAASNIPGARANAVGLTDSNGKFWLFAGNGYFAAGEQTFLNDLWEYDPDLGQWAWISGNSKPSGDAAFNPGSYGTEGVPAVTNLPGGRIDAYGWVDAYGNFWFFGGQGDVSSTSDGFPNDLWVFHPPTGEWTWMSGSDTLTGGDCTSGVGACGVPGTYPASTGMTAATNEPGGRHSGFNWSDENGNLWMLDGAGFDSTTTDYGLLNDLWEYQTPAPAAPPAIALPAGTYISPQTVKITDATQSAVIYYTIDGSAPTTSSSIYKSPITVSTPETVKALAVAAGYLESAISAAAYNFAAANPAFTPASGTYRTDESVTITDSTPGAVIYYTLDRTTPTDRSTKYKGAIQIDSTMTVKAIAVVPGLEDSAPSTARYVIAKPQTIDFVRPPSPVTYGVKPIDLVATASSGLPVSFVVVSGPGKLASSSKSEETVLKVTGWGTVLVAAEQAGNSSYAPALEAIHPIKVNRAELTVAANSPTIKQGAAIPTLTYTMTGFVNGDTQKTATSGAPKLTTTATSTSKPGTYPITIVRGTLEAESYYFNLVPGTLTIK